MSNQEFMDAFSDDLIFLEEARMALLTHPLRPYAGLSRFVNASAVRLLVTVVIASTEEMLARESKKLYDLYRRKGENVVRLKRLEDAFVDAGVAVDREVLDDYLAVKYMRNAIVHFGFKDEEKVWIESRGFVAHSGRFTKSDLDRIRRVHQKMMLYIFCAAHPESAADLQRRFERVERVDDDPLEETGILRIRDLNSIVWNNLERIHAHLWAKIEDAVTLQKVAVTDLADDDADAHEKKRRYYLAVRRAGQEYPELFASLRAVAKETVAFWLEYKSRALPPELSGDRATQALVVLENHEFPADSRLLTVLTRLPEDAAEEMVKAFLRKDASLERKEIVEAVRIGEVAHEIVPNSVPAELLAVLLPIIDPDNASTYLTEAGYALRLCRLNLVWRARVEGRGLPDLTALDLFSRMRLELGGGASETVH